MTAPFTTEDFAAKMAAVKAASMALVAPSPAERLALCEAARGGTVVDLLGRLSPLQHLQLVFDWNFWARPKQRAPEGEWDVWLNLGGRGVGKTRSSVEWLSDRLQRGLAKEIAIVGPNHKDLRKIQIGGYERRADGCNGSGFLDVLPPWIKYELKEQKGEILFHDLNARAYFISAEKPEFVGHNPDTVWGDEPIKWPNPEKLLEHIFLSNRKKGKVRPQLNLSTTPRPFQFIRELIMEPGTVTTHSRTWENRSNLSEAFLARMKRTYAGTSPQVHHGRAKPGPHRDRHRSSREPAPTQRRHGHSGRWARRWVRRGTSVRPGRPDGLSQPRAVGRRRFRAR